MLAHWRKCADITRKKKVKGILNGKHKPAKRELEPQKSEANRFIPSSARINRQRAKPKPTTWEHFSAASHGHISM